MSQDLHWIRRDGGVERAEWTRLPSQSDPGAVWSAKYRLPDGRQAQTKIGPAWTDRGRPPAGYVTKRTPEAWLRDVLDQARRGTLPGLVRTGATFADAAVEYLRYAEHDRGCNPSTLRDHRSTIRAHLLPAFGSMRVEDIDPATVERWRAALPPTLSPRTKNTLLIQLHGIFRRALKVYALRGTRWRISSATTSDPAATSRCSAWKRCSRWCGRQSRSRTRRSL